MARLVLLGPARLVDASEGGGVLVFEFESRLVPVRRAAIDVGRIAQLLAETEIYETPRGFRASRRYYIVYEGGVVEGFDARAFSTEWPDSELDPVTRVREKWFLGSECDGELVPGEWVEDTSCVPRYKEVDVEVPFREVDRGEVYARRPTVAELLEWRAVGSNNVRLVAEHVVAGGVAGGEYEECSLEYGDCWREGWRGPVPDPRGVRRAATLEPPFEALVLTERFYRVVTGEDGVESVELVEKPAVLLAFHAPGRGVSSLVEVALHEAGSVEDAERIYTRALKLLGGYVSGETRGLPDVFAKLAEAADEAWRERGLAERLAERMPRWADAIVVVESRDGSVLAYPVKRSRSDEFYYFRVRWRPVDKGEHLNPLVNKLVHRDGRVEDALWLQDGEWVRVYAPRDAPPVSVRRLRRMMASGVDTTAGRRVEAELG